jgi:signal transduction histidine kinase/ligand-binding sensor domain-containing protein
MLEPAKKNRKLSALQKSAMCLAIALFACFTAISQTLPFESLSSELGLSQNMITCLMQDTKGFLWVGTKDGLNRFDGYRFKVYRNDPFDSTSLSNNFINHLIQDEKGRIWASTFKGLNLFDPETETFQRIFPDSTSGETGLNSEKILHFMADARGRIWLNTDDYVLHLLEMPPGSQDARDLRIRRITHMQNEEGEPVPVRGIKFVQDKAGTFWMYSPSGLYRFWESSDGQFTLSKKFPEARDPSWRKTLEELVDEVPSYFFRIGPGRNGSVWVGCADRLGRWDPTTASWEQYPLPAEVPTDSSYFWNEAFEIVEDSKGEVWVSFINGLLSYNTLNNQATWISGKHNPDHPLFAGAAPILEDQGGLLWVGTKGYGLLKLNRNARRFEGKMINNSSKFLYRGESFRAICKTTDGRIWVSQAAQGIYLFNPDKNRIDPVELPGLEGQAISIFSIMEDADGTLWSGASNGLIKITRNEDGSLRHCVNYPPMAGEDKPKSTYVWKVVTSRDGALWMVTSTSLCRFDPEQESFTLFPYLPEKNLTILNNEYPTLYQDHNGILWIGTSEGLLRFDPKSSRFQHFANDPKDPSSLSQNAVKVITGDPLDPGRFLWVGTGGGGLIHFDKEKEQFESFTEKDGLPDMVVYAILPDAAGNLWLSTNKGLSVFRQATRSFRNFTEKDGLQNLEFNSGSYFKSKEGQLFFGGIKGFNAFYPEDMLEMNQHIPPIVLTEFRISNKPVSLQDPRSILPKEISYCQKLVLKHDVKIISFEFAALDFADPSQNQFACMMVGFDKDWQQLSHAHSATYTNLDAGSYTFRVKGANNDGVWNETGTTIEIVVLPPWWGTWWAFTLYGLTIAGILAAFLRLQNKRNQDKAEAERLKLLNEAKSTFLSTVSHELRTPLTSIMGFSKIIKKRMSERILPSLNLEDPLLARTTLQVMQNLDIVVSESERLTSLINQVLDLAKIEAGKVEWQDEVFHIEEVIQHGSSATAMLFSEKRIPLILLVDEGLPPVFGDKARLIQVMINLLSNAVKFTQKGKVKCSASRQGDQIVVRVEDTGIGIPEKDLIHIFEKFKQIGDDTLTDKPQGSGLGLPICKEIIERHGGKIWAESTPEKGSVFSFTLPVTKKTEPQK